MTATEEPTLYDVLEVDPGSSVDELRAAVERARETYGPESLAVYALVDEVQLGELRAKLDEAASVLLDPARRATYDRSIGRLGPSTLWTEDEEEDPAPLPPVEPGPHAPETPLELEASGDEEGEEPRQEAFALELDDRSGPFARAAPESEEPPAPAPLLSEDWAAAVPAEQQTPRASTQPEPAVETPAAPVETAGRGAAGETSGVPGEAEPAGRNEDPAAASSDAESPSERGRLPPSLGLRVKPGAGPASPAPEHEPSPEPAVAPGPAERAPEPPARPREGRSRLDIPADAEFNGELLRRVRESYGLSLQQVAERTRITRIHLENVEADRYDHLPATVYLRGILVNLARELRLDPARVSKTYLLAAQRAHGRAP